MTLQRLSSFEAALLAAERPGAPLHSTAIIVLDPSTMPGGYSFDTLRARIARMLVAAPRLRSRVVPVAFGLARPFWANDRDLDLTLHIRRAAAPRPGGPREIAEMAADMNARRLDRSRPLWEMAVVEGLQNGSVALLLKLHCALQEDFPGLALLASLSSESESAGSSGPSVPTRYDRVPSELGRLAGALPSLLAQPLRLTGVGGRALRALIRETARVPEPEAEAEAAQTGAARSELDGSTSAGRSAAYASLRLADVLAVARAGNASADAVVLAIVAGALRRALFASGQLPARPLVAALLTPRTEPASAEAEIGPKVSIVRLPTDVEDELERLRAVSCSAGAAQDAEPGPLADALRETLQASSPLLLDLASRLVAGLELAEYLPPICNLLVSRVAGQRGTRYLGGARIQNVYALGPVAAGINLHITSVVMGASVDVGISACRQRVPDPWRIAAGLASELSALLPRAAREGDERSAG